MVKFSLVFGEWYDGVNKREGSDERLGDIVMIMLKMEEPVSTKELTPSVRFPPITRSLHSNSHSLLAAKSPVNSNTVQVRSAWTRGLAIHPVAAGVSFVALLLGLSTHITITLLASLISFLAALITAIAFAVDIALLALVRHEMNNLDIGANTNAGPGTSFYNFILGKDKELMGS